MAEPERPRQEEGASSEPKLYTLSEVSQRSGISMPTLQRYKKLYQSRIPATGKGRKQRYPEEAFKVFEQIKQENVGRRGRPRKDASAAPAGAARGRKAGGSKKAAKATKSTKAAKTAKAPARRGAGRPAAGATGGRRGRTARSQGSGNLLTLTEVSERTGISYPTLVRYVRLHENRLPHEGRGRARRFHPEAVDVFRQLRQESGRGGRKPGSGAGSGGRVGRPRKDEGALGSRMRTLEKSQQALEKRLRSFVKSLQRLLK